MLCSLVSLPLLLFCEAGSYLTLTDLSHYGGLASNSQRFPSAQIKGLCHLAGPLFPPFLAKDFRGLGGGN